MEFIVAWLITLSLAVVVLFLLLVKLVLKTNANYIDNMKLRARLNMMSDKGDPIRRTVRPFIRESKPIEFALKELTDDDSFENIVQ